MYILTRVLICDLTRVLIVNLIDSLNDKSTYTILFEGGTSVTYSTTSEYNKPISRENKAV